MTLRVALVTQAGGAGEEDFPGLAALVDPSGQVTARLPDSQPGTLTVDLPLTIQFISPVRCSADPCSSRS